MQWICSCHPSSSSGQSVLSKNARFLGILYRSIVLSLSKGFRNDTEKLFCHFEAFLSREILEGNSHWDYKMHKKLKMREVANLLIYRSSTNVNKF